MDKRLLAISALLVATGLNAQYAPSSLPAHQQSNTLITRGEGGREGGGGGEDSRGGSQRPGGVEHPGAMGAEAGHTRGENQGESEGGGGTYYIQPTEPSQSNQQQNPYMEPQQQQNPY